MSDYTNIIQEINTNIPDNTDQSITALKVRTTLIDMLDAVDDNMTEAIEEISVPTKTSDLTNDSGFITATSLEPFVTKTELSNASYVSHAELNSASYVTQSALNSMSYATQSFVDDAISDAVVELNIPTKTSDLTNDSGFITASALNGYVTESQLQQAGYATETYVADYVATHSGPIDLSAYVSKDELNQMGYVSQSDLSNASYVSHAELNNASYVTQSALNSMSYATTSDLNTAISGINVPTKTSELTNDSGFITSIPAEYVTENELSAMSYATTSQLPNMSNYVSKTELDNASYATTNDLNTAISGINVPTKTSDLTNDSGFITSIPAEYVTESELSGMGYVTSTELSNAGYITMGDVSAQGYITSIPSEYVTETELSAKGYITSIPAEYVTESELSAMSYATTSQLPNMSDYVSKTELSNASYVTQSELSNAGYVTNTSLSNMGYITSSDIPAIPVIDENIIPNTTLTYTLGDSSHLYDATYTNRLYATYTYTNSESVIYSPTNSQINVDIGTHRFVMNNSSFFASPGKTLGKSDRQWSYTYSVNFIENGTDIKDIYTQTEVVTQAEYDALPTEEKNSETIYVISDQQAYFDNELVTEQSLSAKGYLTANNFQYDQSTGTLTLIL